jgi:tetratricopeptide (TPR) repeat protein
MSFLKALFGGSEENPVEEKKNNDAKRFDMLKFDGVKAMKLGKFDAAVNFFNEALKTKEDIEIHEYLSRCYIALDRLDDSLEELNLLAQVMPENISLPLQMAHVAYMKEDYDRMIQICQQAQAIDEKNSRVHYFYAQALIGKKDPVAAVAQLTQAISLDEKSGDAHLLRGQTLYGMGDMGGALNDVKWLLDHVQPQEDVLLLGARVMHAGGNDEVACRLYDAITEMNPFQIDAYRERGKIRFDKGDKQGAQEDLQKVLELDPKTAENINGDFSAEGVEEQVKRAYSAINPFGL